MSVNEKAVGVHRLMYLERVGPIPDGMVVMHSCDVRNCCNPGHLSIGTNNDNASDMKSKGRSRGCSFPGEANPGARLTSRDVQHIRTLCSIGTHRGYVATMYGVKLRTIDDIVTGQRWKHLHQK